MTSAHWFVFMSFKIMPCFKLLQSKWFSKIPKVCPPSPSPPYILDVIYRSPLIPSKAKCFENFWPGPCFPLSWLVFSNFKSLVFNAPDLYLTLYIPTRGTHICPSLIVIFRLSKTGCEQLPNFLLASSTLTTDFESLSLLLFKEVYGWKKEPWFLFQKWLMGKKYLQTKFYHWSQKPFTVDCSSILPRLRFLIFTIVWQGTFLIKGLLTINVSISWRWPAKHYCKLLIQ